MEEVLDGCFGLKWMRIVATVFRWLACQGTAESLTLALSLKERARVREIGGKRNGSSYWLVR